MMTIYHSKEGKELLKYISFQKNKLENFKNISYYTYSREAIFEILKKNNITQEDEVLMPSYQCNTVIDYVLPFSNQLAFYKIDEKLNFDYFDIETKITNKTKVIFFVHYFGIISDINNEFLKRLKEKNIIIIHDLAHCFLSLYDRNFTLNIEGDYIISSIYKNIPIGVGSIVLGDMNISKKIDIKEFAIINVKKVFSHLRCFIGKKSFSYFDINDKTTYQENAIMYKRSKIGFYIYHFIVKHLAMSKIIKDKRKVSERFFDIFKNNNLFLNIFTEESLSKNVLQAYPVFCHDKKLREELFLYLKKSCIDVYPWPTYHFINSHDNLKEKIILLPLDMFTVRKVKIFFEDKINE